jgi:hypothetical protein
LTSKRDSSVHETGQYLQDNSDDMPAESPLPLTPYRIQPGDSLDIKFFYNPELNELLVVRPDGYISLQLVNEVMVAGLEPKEVNEMLTEKYSQELRKPVVTVIVKSFGRPAGLCGRRSGSAGLAGYAGRADGTSGGDAVGRI